MIYLRCSECFTDEGLRVLALDIGQLSQVACPSCGGMNGRKLDRASLVNLAEKFFVRGTFVKANYGGSSVIDFSEGRVTDVSFKEHLKKDVQIFEESLGIGFFYKCPPTWMVGEVQPLNDLLDPSKRGTAIEKIFNSYPSITLSNFTFYRVRFDSKFPKNRSEYDSPPVMLKDKKGRLDLESISVLYGSFDISTCLHECRIKNWDSVYIATLSPKNEIKLLDLTKILTEDVTPFESLDVAVSILFEANEHSYEICQDVAREALKRGYDGIVYPSYFSELQSGLRKFESNFSLLLRSIPKFKDILQRQIYPNLAIFGHPVAEGKLEVKCINRIYVNRIEYDYGLGPILE